MSSPEPRNNLERWKFVALVLMACCAPILLIDNVIRAFDDPTTVQVFRALAWCAVVTWVVSQVRAELRSRRK